jgi:hypothetical protein
MTVVVGSPQENRAACGSPRAMLARSVNQRLVVTGSVHRCPRGHDYTPSGADSTTMWVTGSEEYASRARSTTS